MPARVTEWKLYPKLEDFPGVDVTVLHWTAFCDRVFTDSRTTAEKSVKASNMVTHSNKRH